jgi:hypothetical protein
MAFTADIQQQVYDLLSRASNISFVSADQEAGKVSLLTPGQRVSAEVLSTLPNNLVQVQIGTELFNLALPMAVRTGQMVEMTFVSGDPRSTFAIARQAGITPPVSLSDASRLLSMLVSNEQIVDPKFRSSLQNISDMLRSSSGSTGVLANLMDEAMTYGLLRDGVKAAPRTPGDSMNEPGDHQGANLQQNPPRLTPEQARLAAFETNAAQILRTIAQSSRFTLIETANQPVVPLPLLPGEEVEAVVVGTLPGGRVFVQVAGTVLEMVLPRMVANGDILRLTYIASQPKLTFAFPRATPDGTSGVLSEAGRWLSVLEHSEGGVSSQQMYVMDRLNTVLKSLPPDSPAFTAILDEAITYGTLRRGKQSEEQSATVEAQLSAPLQTPVMVGNGMVLSDDMAKLLQAVIKGNRLALLEALNQQALPAGFSPGQQLKGEVLAALGGGRFMVQVAGKSMEFMMPKGISRGDLVNLFFISEEPRQTFLMARFGNPGDSQVSGTGRWLSGFLSETSGQVPAQATLGLLRTLLAGPPADAPLLGRMLQQELRESGLFYESHLARWFGGDYPLDEILKEPQGRLSPRLMLPMELNGVMNDDLVRAGARSGSTEIMEAAFKQAGDGMTHEGIADQRSLPIVGEQLSALQSGQLVFHGELFPGQHMEWSVVERDAGRNKSGGRERSWETSVAISLQHLGPITARLTFDGARVALKISAEDSLTVPVLESGKARLVEQLEGAGLDPAEMSIAHAAT